MSEKEKTLTNDAAYIKLKRIDCLEKEAKNGDKFYLISGLYKQDEQSRLVEFFTKDKDLFAEVLAIPVNTEFKMYYELKIDSTNTWKVKPVACSI